MYGKVGDRGSVIFVGFGGGGGDGDDDDGDGGVVVVLLVVLLVGIPPYYNSLSCQLSVFMSISLYVCVCMYV